MTHSGLNRTGKTEQERKSLSWTSFKFPLIQEFGIFLGQFSLYRKNIGKKLCDLRKIKWNMKSSLIVWTHWSMSATRHMFFRSVLVIGRSIVLSIERIHFGSVVNWTFVEFKNKFSLHLYPSFLHFSFLRLAFLFSLSSVNLKNQRQVCSVKLGNLKLKENTNILKFLLWLYNLRQLREICERNIFPPEKNLWQHVKSKGENSSHKLY